mgnify:FL=1
MITTQGGYPAISNRSRGWLRYLHRKATTPDNWDKNGRPHAHWDGITGEPMLSWQRFDLIESSYAMALMADTTPAWCEVYSTILDELAFRYTGYWAAKDWLDQIGPDPRRKKYPQGWSKLLPAHLQGEYDVPGWTANGVEPWGLQMDPIGAAGNLFFKGWFLVILGLYRYVSGDDKWNQPFDMVRDGENTFTWSHTEIAKHLTTQWSGRPEGCH